MNMNNFLRQSEDMSTSNMSNLIQPKDDMSEQILDISASIRSR